MDDNVPPPAFRPGDWFNNLACSTTIIGGVIAIILLIIGGIIGKKALDWLSNYSTSFALAINFLYLVIAIIAILIALNIILRILPPIRR